MSVVRFGRIGALRTGADDGVSTPCKCKEVMVGCLDKKTSRSWNAAPGELTTRSVQTSKSVSTGRERVLRRDLHVGFSTSPQRKESLVSDDEASRRVETVQLKNVY